MTEHTSRLLGSVESQFNKLQASKKFLFDCGDFSSTLTRPLDSPFTVRRSHSAERVSVAWRK